MPRVARASRLSSRQKPASAESSRGLAPERGGGGREQRHEAGLVGAVGGQALGGDDLMRGVDRDLAVVALDEAVPGLHDPAVGVGEVALRPRGRAAVRGARRPAVIDHARGRAGLGVRAADRPWPRPPGRLGRRGYAPAAPAGRRPSRATRRRAGPGQARHPRRHPRPRPGPASLGPRPRAPPRPTASGHSSSPCACSRWP